MDLILAKKTVQDIEQAVYLAKIDLAEKYARLGYTIYIQHPDGSLEKYMDPIT